ncbi:hypothetical protein SAMD00079811_28250 [Scytonema sp. HK-05]|nr:hypothetical protein NIES2130_34825 [Scytonema sp. HK-05]BAY45223.1 hypothetical protein SAMD00079811_28250 [Scytonema sp. HK-05]
MGAALPLLREAEPQVMHSQPEAGNEAISKSLFYSGFHVIVDTNGFPAHPTRYSEHFLMQVKCALAYS